MARAGHRQWDTRVRGAVWSGAALLLAAALALMQVSPGMTWSGSDFAVWGVLLLLPCAGAELVLRLSANWFYRAGFAVALGTAVLMVWANLAVGFIGDEGEPANRMFAGVLAVGALGALVARFRPGGMALALVATAAAQALVTAVALVQRMDIPLAPTAIFLALWLTSAWLFHRAQDAGATGTRTPAAA